MHRFPHALRGKSRALLLAKQLNSAVPGSFPSVRPSSVIGPCTPYITSRCIHSSPPSRGVTDSLRNAYESAFSGAEEKREAKMFDVQMSFLTDRERSIDGDVYLDLLEKLKEASGMGGVKEHLPWVQSNPALQEFKDSELILCSLTPAERRNIRLVQIAARKRIASSSNLPLGKIEATIDQLGSLIEIQKWMWKRMDSGLPVPRDQQEMQNMLSTPGSGLRKRRSRGQRFPNPGIGAKLRKR